MSNQWFFVTRRIDYKAVPVWIACKNKREADRMIRNYLTNYKTSHYKPVVFPIDKKFLDPPVGFLDKLRNRRG